MEPLLLHFPGEFGALIHLTLATILALLYIKHRSIAILPAIMISSLIGVFLGFEIHPFISGISGFAAALIVFIAGLELKPEFIKKNKERVLIMFFFEATIFFTIFYLLVTFLPLQFAVTIAAIMVASNEAFVLDLEKYGDEELAQFGITISVLEDASAVFLLSLGFFTTLTISLPEEHLALLLAIIVMLIPLFYIISEPFDRFIDKIERLDAKVLLSILYLEILISTAEVLGIPEAITVFIGAVNLSLRGFDKEAFRAMESYYVLALIGFVASLPYNLESSIPQLLNISSIMFVVVAGILLALIAFVLRASMIIIAGTMGGLGIKKSLELGISLGNTGEFGLIVLAALIGEKGIIPPDLALAAMVAYAVNLTLVSYFVKNIVKLTNWLLSRAHFLWNFLDKVSESADDFVMYAAKDESLKKDILGMSIMLIVGYFSLFVQRLVTHVFITYIMSIAVISSFIVAIQKFYHAFSESVERKLFKRGYVSAFMMLMRFLILYVIVAPMISFLSIELTEYKLALRLEHPVSIFLILLTIYGLSYISERLANFFFEEKEEIVEKIKELEEISKIIE